MQSAGSEPQAQPRVCLGLVEVSGVMTRLARGFAAQGIDVTFVDLEPSPFAYGEDTINTIPPVVRLLRRMRRFERANAHRGTAVRVALRLSELPARVVLFVWAVRRFDVFVFGYRATFLHLADLPILKLLGKRVIGIFFGSDERPPFMDGYVAPHLNPGALVRRTRVQHAVIRFFGRFADVVVAGPNSGQFWHRPAIVYQVLGNPVDLADSELVKQPRRPGPVRILHAPSNPQAKGSDRIREAIANVRAAGHEFDYEEVRGVPNRVLQEAIAQADVVIDQAFGDTPYAMLPAEASLLGKPVIVGGYGWDELRRFLPEDFVWPAVCHPDELEATIIALITDEQERRRIGAASKAYIEQNWAPAEVARKYTALLAGDPPPEWQFDPRTIVSVWGNGVSREQLARSVRVMVERSGPTSLRVDHNPALRARLLGVAGLDPDD